MIALFCCVCVFLVVRFTNKILSTLEMAIIKGYENALVCSTRFKSPVFHLVKLAPFLEVWILSVVLDERSSHWS